MGTTGNPPPPPPYRIPVGIMPKLHVSLEIVTRGGSSGLLSFYVSNAPRVRFVVVKYYISSPMLSRRTRLAPADISVSEAFTIFYSLYVYGVWWIKTERFITQGARSQITRSAAFPVYQVGEGGSPLTLHPHNTT